MINAASRLPPSARVKQKEGLQTDARGSIAAVSSGSLLFLQWFCEVCVREVLALPFKDKSTHSP